MKDRTVEGLQSLIGLPGIALILCVYFVLRAARAMEDLNPGGIILNFYAAFACAFSPIWLDAILKRIL